MSPPKFIFPATAARGGAQGAPVGKIRKEAARWFARMRSAAPDDPLRGRFEAWLTAHPLHAAEYAAFDALWQRLDSTERCDALADLMEERRRSRRRFVKSGTAGLLLMGIGVEAYRYRRQNEPLWQAGWQTAIGQQVQHQSLKDGSVVVLNAGTQIEVMYSRAERRIELRKGEAIFDVTKNANCPFVVQAAAARVIVLGTRFAVNKLPDSVRVSVERGSVRMESGRIWNRQQLMLQAGQVGELELTGDQEGSIHSVQRSAADAFAFERGFIMLDMARLTEVAEVFSRYRAEPVRVAPGRPDADPRITAAIRTADVERFLNVLPRMVPVAVRRDKGAVLLAAQ